MESQQCRWLEDNRCALNIVWREIQRSETKQHSVNDSEIRFALPRTIDYQELLFHEKAFSDNGFCTTRSHEFSDSG